MKAALFSLAMILALLALPATAQDQVDAIESVEEAATELREAPATPPATPEPDDETTTPETDDEATQAPDNKKPAKTDALRFFLMDGTIITGKLTAKALPIKTEFGDLVVPIDAVEHLSPGLDSHPKIDQEIKALIQALGSPDAKARDKAQAQLLTYGPGLIPELQEHADDPDAERKVRIATIIEELLAIREDAFGLDQDPRVSLVRLDHIVTQRFTVAGKIMQDTFTIESKFGELSVKLKDIKAVERMSAERPEQRRTVEVSGTDMTCRAYKKTALRVNRGDRIIISAEGQINMSPWGSNSVSGPDGIPQNGMYNGKIPLGALAGRIGDSGEEFLVGSKNTFVAKQSGVLHLGFAMQQNWANYQFPGTYKARIRVVPAE